MAKPSSLAVCAGTLCISTVVLAQTQPAQTAQNTETLSTVIVTGSRIIHTDTDTPSPVQVITPLSPLGEALMGRKVGDKAELKTPAGTHTYKIVEIN